MDFYLPFHFIHFSINSFPLFLYFQGLNLLELPSHLEEKVAQLWCAGLGRIKMALAGNDSSSLLEILEGSFGHVNLDTSALSVSTEESAQKSTTAEKTPEKTSEVPEKTSVTPSYDGGLASAELVFPPKVYYPCHHWSSWVILATSWPETLSHYQCQFPACTQEFSQKAATCNHVWCDHLNVALACLYCSFENNPKVHWYSTSPPCQSHLQKSWSS